MTAKPHGRDANATRAPRTAAPNHGPAAGRPVGFEIEPRPRLALVNPEAVDFSEQPYGRCGLLASGLIEPKGHPADPAGGAPGRG